jgi:tight adherence protein B
MAELLESTDLVLAATIFVVVALGTVSFALLWEAVRRWLRDRAATQALQKIGGFGEGRGPGRKALEETSVVKEDAAGPAWLEPVLPYLPQREDLRRLLDQAGLRWSVASMVLASLGMAVGLGLAASVLAGGWLVPIVTAGIGSYLPVAFVKFKRSRRFQAFEEHFPEAVDLLARAARAGHSLATGLEVVGEEAEEPVAAEFRHIYEEQRFGLPLSDSLLGLADRMDLLDVRIFVTAVLIQRESGGNLAENLDGLSAVIRGRFRFKRDVKTKSAHGRMTATVVGVAPFVIGVGMYALNPDYIQPLLTESMGQLMLLIGGVLMVLGFVTIRRMADLKV